MTHLSRFFDCLGTIVNVLYLLDVVITIVRWSLPSTQLRALEVAVKRNLRAMEVGLEGTDDADVYEKVVIQREMYVFGCNS